MDLLIRNGRLIDGIGAAPKVADVAIDGSLITRVTAPGALGPKDAQEVIDATHLLVTPGFIDPHTHYDGQATWDDRLSPSAEHGITTVVRGSCGVGFAPVRPGEQDYLTPLMEGVEDIPGSALSDGIDWSWESFPEYLDAPVRKPTSIDPQLRPRSMKWCASRATVSKPAARSSSCFPRTMSRLAFGAKSSRPSSAQTPMAHTSSAAPSTVRAAWS
jgi:hypothetical protein